MTLKAKLVSTIAAFALVLALLVVGVLAASSATVNMSGSLSFTADDVAATVKVSSTGAKQNISAADKTISFDSSNDTASQTWNDLDLAFSDKNTDIVITIEIKNDSTERAMTVTTATLPSVTGSNVEATLTYSTTNASPVTDQTLPTTAINVEKGKTCTIKMTIGIKNTNLSVTGSSWTAALALANVAA